MIENRLVPYIPERFLRDENYRQWHISGVHPLPGVRIMGVHIPEMKKIASSFIKEGKGNEMLSSFSVEQKRDARAGLYYEEKQIWGMIINRLSISLDERLRYVQSFIPVIDNWAVCDIFCADAKWVLEDKTRVWKFLEGYFHSEKEFEVRFALVMAMGYYLDAEHIEEIYKTISSIDYAGIQSEYEDLKMTPYYVYMAAGWLMATALYKLPEATRAFANSGKCPSEILKIYVRKAKESFRTKNTSPF